MSSVSVGVRTSTNTGGNTGIKAMSAAPLPVSASVSGAVSGVVPVSGVGGVVYRLKGRLRSSTIHRQPVGAIIGGNKLEGNQADLNAR